MALRGLFAASPAFDAAFPRCARFPGVLYLAPEPAGPFRALTEAVAARWPETPPYGGQFPDVIPHLTVACSEDPDVLGRTGPFPPGRLISQPMGVVTGLRPVSLEHNASHF